MTNFAKRNSSAATDGAKRPRTRKPPKLSPNDAAKAAMHRVRIEGVVHPIYGFIPDIVLLPGVPSNFLKIPIPRVGQFNEMAVYAEQVVDGPAFVKIYDANEDKFLQDEKERDIEARIKSDDWSNFPVFKVKRGMRLSFQVVNQPTFPTNMSVDDRAALTGSDTLSVIGLWFSGMYFAKGANRGDGQQPERPPTPGP